MNLANLACGYGTHHSILKISKGNTRAIKLLPNPLAIWIKIPTSDIVCHG
jgi:hypothetical protein